MKIDFSLYTPQQLRDAIEVEMQKTNDPKTAAITAVKKLNADNNYLKMEKAKDITKLIKKIIINKLGIQQTVYVEPEEKKEEKTDVKLKMRFDSHSLIFNFNLIGFEERVGDEKTTEKALNKAKDIENNISSFDKEHTNIINEEGKILLSKSGNYDEIDFDEKEINTIRNSEILTHTHPQERSFSAEDVFLALSLGIKELRVKTPENTYFFKISHKSPAKDKNYLKNKNRKFMTVLMNLNDHVTDIYSKKVQAKTISAEEAEKEHREVIWGMVADSPLLADDFNIEYGKVGK